jgi:hypothetical protein
LLWLAGIAGISTVLTADDVKLRLGLSYVAGFAGLAVVREAARNREWRRHWSGKLGLERWPRSRRDRARRLAFWAFRFGAWAGFIGVGFFAGRLIVTDV